MQFEFKVRSKTDFDDGVANIHMEVVPEGSDINKVAFKGFPGGYFDVQAITPEISAQLSVGKKYVISVTEVK